MGNKYDREPRSLVNERVNGNRSVSPSHREIDLFKSPEGARPNLAGFTIVDARSLVVELNQIEVVGKIAKREHPSRKL